jgi:hypothetical protein
MSIDIRFPNITAPTAEGQMAQMQSYMHQLVQQLNWALNTIGDAQSGNTSNVVVNNSGNEISPKEAEDTFNSIKALIIKSADIVKAYEETIKKDFNGEYFAESDFGTYLVQTKNSIEENSSYSRNVYSKVETITNKDGNGILDELSKDVRTTNNYIQKGYLGDDKDTGDAVYGIAVGETDNKGVYRKYAWFTADKLTFFDEGDNPVAYIGNGCLYVLGTSRFIGDVFFMGREGTYKVDTSDGLAFTWIG